MRKQWIVLKVSSISGEGQVSNRFSMISFRKAASMSDIRFFSFAHVALTFFLLLNLSLPNGPAMGLNSDQNYIFPVEPWPILDRLGELLSIPSEDTELPVIMIWNVSDLQMTTEQASAISLALAGDFNGWKPQDCEVKSSDIADEAAFQVNMSLKPGTYAYKIVVNGKWIPDPCAASQGPDGYGGINSILTVGKPVSNERLYPSSLWLDSSGGCNILFRTRVSVIAAAMAVNGIPADSSRVSICSEGVVARVENSIVREYAGNSIRVTVRALDGNSTPLMSFDQFIDLPIQDGESGSGNSTGIIYFAMTDRFRNGDVSNDRPVKAQGLDSVNNFMGGDFAGLRQTLDEGYFSSLAVDYLWISPVQKSADGAWRDSLPPHSLFTGYHGYWPVSMTQVESRQGTLTELRKLGSALEERGMGLLLDGVFNHVHRDHPLFQAHPDWFSSLLTPDGRSNVRLFNEFSITTWFDDFLPSFDYAADSRAIDNMVRNGLWWLSVSRARGFRLDAVKHIDPLFWRSFREAINRRDAVNHPKAVNHSKAVNSLEAANRSEAVSCFEALEHAGKSFLVGETISDRNSISRALRRGDVPLQFDFPLYYAIRDTFAQISMDYATLEDQLRKSEHSFAGLNLVSTLVGNHDFPRFMEYAADHAEKSGLSPDMAYEALGRAFAFILTNRGYPLIYYGDELGMNGRFAGDNRSPMIFSDDLDVLQAALLENVRKLTVMRARWTVLVRGERFPVISEASRLVYGRVWPGQSALVIFGAADSIVEFDVPEWFAAGFSSCSSFNGTGQIVNSGHEMQRESGSLPGNGLVKISVRPGSGGFAVFCWKR
ncbi:MAG: hypothetical protein CVV64_19835 [Candidatus Wallbacteria bacterium HGW-Wallbacteria-1]|jgi:glycosidase|uniref:Glycosyl hydrolase family 13 catalytic domain-containing protein n=1 Tax=Candidatus Wallbacteria bacterium HGW-Wallbacteria-1 TaxID=2013854 RepID=A0A2N1PIR5_9BACT|nr:MAG: hypothetical protein CVV64_19835 [Candidatus Wallbacteria bacterium HGW-Wallbacteria-1]